MTETLVMERVQANLSRLRLSRVVEVLSDFVKTAEERSLGYLSFLDELLEEEVARKDQRRLETTLKVSGLPFAKSIDEYDFTFQPKLDRQKVMSLFDLTFIERKENVIFLGPPGVGKTHLAVSLAIKACQAGLSIYFTTMADLITKLAKDHQEGKKGKGRSYYKSSLVIVDEVGYTPLSREECNLFYRFIANRYERNTTIITSNKSFADWTELFDDQIIVTAILDRLLHHSVVVNIKGNSYRLKGKLPDHVMEVQPKEN
jgi:DNA replication protein DnaC